MVKKHFNKLIIGIAFVLVFVSGILFEAFMTETVLSEQPAQQGKEAIAPEDYIISKSVDILANKDNYVHTDDTVVKGIIKEIVFSKDNPDKFIVESLDDKEYEIAVKDMELISAESSETDDGEKSVELAFRTGEKVTLTEGEDTKLYKTQNGEWSFDKREHEHEEQSEFLGTVEDFVFLPTTTQKGDIYISHIIFENKDGDSENLYLHNLDLENAASKGEMRVYYTGEILGTQVFDIEESKDFLLNIDTGKYEYALKKGTEVKLVKDAKNDYWELGVIVDTNTYEAEVTGFVFGHDNYNVTSLDYINLKLENDEEIQLTVLQTEALFAVPYGNYEKEFIYDGHEKILSSIEPMEDWRMELYYDDDVVVELSIGAKAAVYKNEDDMWVIDYLYEFEEDAEAEE